MKRKRKNYSAEFKAKVALEATREENSLADLAERFNVHRNQIAIWRKQLHDRAEEIFAQDCRTGSESNVRELHEKIGRLAMEIDFLTAALGQGANKLPNQ